LINKNLVTSATVFVLEDATKLFPSAIGQCLNVLGESEIQRFTKMKSPKRRQKYAIARFLLFEAIRQQLGVQVMMGSFPSGQPLILGHPIFCSISYSGHSISVGFSTYGAMGIDIEKHRQRKIDRLVRHYFHADEIDYFDTLGESQQMLWFYRQWTIKEAASKTNGEGLSMRNLSFKVDEEDTNKTISVFTGNNYSLACVHHSNQLTQMADVAILDSPPWVDFSLRDWSNRNI
jgi:phosphopantetheinyl transferase